MSRNFELLQQLEKEPLPLQAPEPAMDMPPIAATIVPPLFPAQRLPGDDIDTIAQAEEIKLLQRVFFLPRVDTPRVVVFSGIEQGDGCSSLCARIARLLASQTRASVCLIDADVRSPSLHESFEVENRAGLIAALSSDSPVRELVQPVAQERLWLLASGAWNPNAFALLASEQLRTRIAELRREFDFVLIDAPPAAGFTDAMLLGQVTDGVVLIVRANTTRRVTAQKIVEELQAVNVRILGTVLNQRSFPIPQKIYSRL
jgi:capsular exopolysaccharide synthesis family protein